MKRYRLLYVCTGNTCRSPMAASLTEHLGRELALPFDLEVRSRGLYASVGELMTDMAQAVLAEKEIAFEHQAAMLEQEDLEWADLVLTMTIQHKRHLWEEFPDYQEKTYTLKEYVQDRSAASPPACDNSSEHQPSQERDEKGGDVNREQQDEHQHPDEKDTFDGEPVAGHTLEDSDPADFSWEYLQQTFFSSVDVADPFGGDMTVYRQTRNELEDWIRQLLQLLATSVDESKDAL